MSNPNVERIYKGWLQFILILTISISGCISLRNKPATSNVDRKISRYVFKNKLTFIAEDYGFDNKVTIHFWLKIDSRYEPKESAGIAHLLEHIIFETIKKRWLEAFGNSVDFPKLEMDAFTSKDFTYYELNISKEYIEKTLGILSDISIHPSFDDNVIQTEKKNVIREIESRDRDPLGILWKNFAEVCFSGQLYSQDIIGEKKDILDISTEDIQRYFTEFYNPSNMIITIVGHDLDLGKLKEKIGQSFSNVTYKARSLIRDGSLYDEIQRKIINSDLRDIYFAIGWHTPNIRNQDAYALEVLLTLANDIYPIKLKQGILDFKNLKYIQGGYLHHRQGDAIAFYGEISNNIPIIINEFEKDMGIHNLIESLRINISSDDVEEAKAILIRDYTEGRKNSHGRAYSLSLAECLGNIRYDIDYVNMVNKVEVSDVKRVVKKYIGKDNYTLVILKPSGLN